MDQKDSKVYLQDKAFVFSEEKIKALNALLREHGLEINACEFFDFLKQAIEGRELVKFEFTRLLSKAPVNYLPGQVMHFKKPLQIKRNYLSSRHLTFMSRKKLG
ncbi:hypothetical protein QY02_08845 [Campylobacter jejuni]|nr:hypothetical protein QY02_08845 [Campylobacter jejuni]